MNCQAVYQHGNDQYVCTRCGYSWDRDDEAPACKTNEQLGHETLDKLKAEIFGGVSREDFDKHLRSVYGVSNAPKCQVCFETEATMQRDDGTYCCGSCMYGGE